MTNRIAAVFLAFAGTAVSGVAADSLTPPKTGPVQIMKSSELKPGMKGTAWTVFVGTEPEPIPIEIIGLWKNSWGPKQDVIIAKMGGKAQRTNVAGGMSGSPVYIDGKLIGAVALRLSVFSPDSICGITPIELMLEINDIDKSRPSDARTPDKAQPRAQVTLPPGLLAQAVAAGAAPNLIRESPMMIPIETPLTFSGFNQNVLQDFGPVFQQMGVSAVQGGGAGSAIYATKPAHDWKDSLQPGSVVAGVLVSGDMGVTGLGTVTYNDGKRVLAFGHPFFNLGPVNMPMSKGEVLMVLASAFQPNKMANATEIVGELTQDRHSGIMGVLGQESSMIPVTVNVRSVGEPGSKSDTKKFRFNVFVNQKWTPYLMMLTLYNTISGVNDFMEEATYRLTGNVEMDGQPNLSLRTMQASGELPAPAPMVLATWWGEKFNKLFLNAVKTPKLRSVNVDVDLLPERRVASIENAWVASNDVQPGEDVPVKVLLRPYRGERIEREFNLHIPAGTAKGSHRILLSDAEGANRMQTMAGALDRYIDLPETVSLINQERSNNKLYVSLLQSSPTAYYDDKTLPSLPASILNVMQTGRASTRPVITSAESATQQAAIPFDYIVSGSYSLKINVK